jgi:ComF family protein
VSKASRGLLNLVGALAFPDDCHLCGTMLTTLARVPVCDACLASIQPFAADHACVACKTPFANRSPLDHEGKCALCRLGLKGFDDAYTYGSYEGNLRALIHLFKYRRMEPLAQHFGGLMALALPRDSQFDEVVPMPMHWWKRWQRGYNQSELLAREIARRWRVPVRQPVRRRKLGVAQAGLTNAKRRTNVSGAFAANGRLDGKRILLIDDVLTTGATASACARALKRAGAARVTLLTLARTDRRMALDLEFVQEPTYDRITKRASASPSPGAER